MRGEGRRGRAAAGGPWAGSLPLIRPAGRRLGPGAAVRPTPLRRPSLGGRREGAGSRGTDSCAATWATASGRSPKSGLLALQTGWPELVPGALR